MRPSDLLAKEIKKEIIGEYIRVHMPSSSCLDLETHPWVHSKGSIMTSYRGGCPEAGCREYLGFA